MRVTKQTAEVLELAQRVSQTIHDIRVCVFIKPGQKSQMCHSEDTRRIFIDNGWICAAEFRNGTRYK